MLRGGRIEVTAPNPFLFPVSEGRLVGVPFVKLVTDRKSVV